jgi:hypothetical protein
LLNTKELEAEFTKLSRVQRRAILDLAREIEQTTKLPVLPDATIQLRKQTTTKEASMSPRVPEMRYPPHMPRLSSEDTPSNKLAFNKEETNYVKQLFDNIQF